MPGLHPGDANVTDQDAASLSNVWAVDWQHQHHLGAWWECRLPSYTPDPLHQILQSCPKADAPTGDQFPGGREADKECPEG